MLTCCFTRLESRLYRTLQTNVPVGNARYMLVTDYSDNPASVPLINNHAVSLVYGHWCSLGQVMCYCLVGGSSTLRSLITMILLSEMVIISYAAEY